MGENYTTRRDDGSILIRNNSDKLFIDMLRIIEAYQPHYSLSHIIDSDLLYIPTNSGTLYYVCKEPMASICVTTLGVTGCYLVYCFGQPVRETNPEDTATICWFEHYYDFWGGMSEHEMDELMQIEGEKRCEQIREHFSDEEWELMTDDEFEDLINQSDETLREKGIILN